MKRTLKPMLKTSLSLALTLGLLVPVMPLRSADNEKSDQKEAQTVTGEVVDLMCYLPNGAKGEKHAGCAKGCIKSGGPVALLTKDDQLYLIIGKHKPINDQLADLAAKTITVKGNVVERNGLKMIQNVEIEK